ncbi:hypothetical protein PIB30_061607 [Stylosanthes scabra]|uniref:Uncharacterized protein n=1 Tax=Stylosanthes scabra TaxID=79078 RepID=A0ABU6XJF1_9FABA|nr:hypothetical protein [Stylosanthes scabra]
MSQSHLIVGTLYPDGEVIRQEDGIGFVCPNPILCYIEPVEMLDLLKSFLLRTMGALGRKSVRRVAYRLLNILPPLEYKFKIFWLEGDVHVRAMFELHRRYGPRQVMELLFETRNVVHAEASLSCARAAPLGPIAAAPLRIRPIAFLPSFVKLRLLMTTRSWTATSSVTSYCQPSSEIRLLEFLCCRVPFSRATTSCPLTGRFGLQSRRRLPGCMGTRRSPMPSCPGCWRRCSISATESS